MAGRNNTKSVAASSGVATIGMSDASAGQVTSVPTSASGTGTVTARPIGVAGFETVYDSDGNALTFALSSQYTFTIAANILQVKVSSDNSGDTFTLTTRS